MYHRIFTIRTLGVAAALACAGALPAQAAEPFAKCVAAVGKAVGKYEQGRAKATQKCEAGVLKGDIMACPDTDLTDKLAALLAKLDGAIAKGCCGEDGVCGTMDDVATPSALGFGTACADGAEGSDCSAITLTDAGDLAACVVCNAGANVDGLMSTAFDALAPTLDGDLLKCQQEIGAKATKLFGAASKEVTKCRAKDLKGGSCTGTNDAYLGAKSVAKIAKARQKALDSINGKCTGFTGLEIGLPATCPTINSQGAGDSCTDGAIADVGEYLNCLTCVAQRSVVCPECDLCGNGVIDFGAGETCDDGDVEDGDDCPSDCRAAACTLDSNGLSTLVDVAFEAPDGASVAGLTIFVHYPDEVVLMTGSGNVGTGAFTPIPDVAPGVDLTPNDVDYGVRAVVLSQSLTAITPGNLFTMELRLCEGQELSDKQLACVVIDAADPSLQPVNGVTCSAVQQ